MLVLVERLGRGGAARETRRPSPPGEAAGRPMASGYLTGQLRRGGSLMILINDKEGWFAAGRASSWA